MARHGETLAPIIGFEIEETAAWLIAHGANLGISNALIDKFPELGVIAISGVGFDRVDLEHAKKRSIRVSTTPDVPTDDVADLAVGLTLALLARSSGELPLAQKVSGKRFGIVGLGHIGHAIASRLSAFGPVAYFADLNAHLVNIAPGIGGRSARTHRGAAKSTDRGTRPLTYLRLSRGCSTA